jgi:hypothetical protein
MMETPFGYTRHDLASRSGAAPRRIGDDQSTRLLHGCADAIFIQGFQRSHVDNFNAYAVAPQPPGGL